MGTRAWASGPLTHWGMLRVQTGDPSLPITLTGPTRLVELFHWRRGKASPGVWVIESASGRSSPRPDDVDWSQFPMAEAQREMQEYDARTARHVHYRSALV
jgi:hypothetical protein